MAKKKTTPQPTLKPVNGNAAALDIGSTTHMAAVNPEHSGEPIRAFGTFIHNLNDLAVAVIRTIARQFPARRRDFHVRAYLPQRERLVEYTAAHSPHMQKTMMEMNLQLHHVVSDITGAITARQLIRSIDERGHADHPSYRRRRAGPGCVGGVPGYPLSFFGRNHSRGPLRGLGHRPDAHPWPNAKPFTS